MSRFENKPIVFPEGVAVTFSAGVIHAKGTKGDNSFQIPKGVDVKLDEKSVAYGAQSSEELAKVGLCYRMTENLLMGVREGFKKVLEVNGVGYRWSVSGDTLKMQLGFSNDIFCEIPSDLSVEIKGSELAVLGIDKQRVGAFAAKLKHYRPVEPYKGKGIRYKGEVVIKKVGKAGKTSA